MYNINPTTIYTTNILWEEWFGNGGGEAGHPCRHPPHDIAQKPCSTAAPDRWVAVLRAETHWQRCNPCVVLADTAGAMPSCDPYGGGSTPTSLQCLLQP